MFVRAKQAPLESSAVSLAENALKVDFISGLPPPIVISLPITMLL